MRHIAVSGCHLLLFLFLLFDLGIDTFNSIRVISCRHDRRCVFLDPVILLTSRIQCIHCCHQLTVALSCVFLCKLHLRKLLLGISYIPGTFFCVGDFLLQTGKGTVFLINGSNSSAMLCVFCRAIGAAV